MFTVTKEFFFLYCEKGAKEGRGTCEKRKIEREREREGGKTLGTLEPKKSIVIVVGRGESSRQPVHAMRQRERPIFPHFTVKL
jgi:hypothetical protein